VVLVALVLLGVVAVLGFVKPAFFVPTVAHQTSMRAQPTPQVSGLSQSTGRRL
jgi:hypothetical protein